MLSFSTQCVPDVSGKHFYMSAVWHGSDHLVDFDLVELKSRSIAPLNEHFAYSRLVSKTKMSDGFHLTEITAPRIYYSPLYSPVGLVE